MDMISIAKDFSPTPGGRFIDNGEKSGEAFRQELLLPFVQRAMQASGKVTVDLDGTAGYATSFLEEAFGGLVRSLKRRISPYLQIQSDNEFRKREVEGYIRDAEAKL